MGIILKRGRCLTLFGYIAHSLLFILSLILLLVKVKGNKAIKTSLGTEVMMMPSMKR